MDRTDDHVDENNHRMPMPIDRGRCAEIRWLEKPVLESRLLANMESLGGWSIIGPGETALTDERSRAGTRSLRLTFPSVNPEDPAKSVDVGVRLEADGEDWTAYNRISFWVYCSQPGFPSNTMFVTLRNDSAKQVPDMYRREGRHFLVLEPEEWTHVVWEIPNLARDRVTGLEFAYHQRGLPPSGSPTGVLYFDRPELQRVEADHYEGWDVAPGRIAFSHTGYLPGFPKTAIAGDLDAEEFTVVDSDSGETVFQGKVHSVETPLGTFQELNFSEVVRPGRYRLAAGGVRTETFEIGSDVWTDTIWKVLNFLYCERCGMSVPGIHGVCHGDVVCEHDGKRIVVDGGWHDAGDLSQMIVHTASIVYALFDLSKKVSQTDPDLSRRILDEARWGLDYVMKSRFGDGYRVDTRPLGVWTDGILGTEDDKTFPAKNTPFENFISAAAETAAWRALRESDPKLASLCLRAAEEDWYFALEEVNHLNVDISGVGGLAAVDLYEATGDGPYLEKAVEFADVILRSQERGTPAWDIPLSGFFYADPSKKQILRYNPRSQMHLPIMLLAKLCRSKPDHPAWIHWYAAVARYAEYLKSAVRFTEPYEMAPSSVYRLDEEPSPGVYSNQENLYKYREYESQIPQYREQVENGIPLSPNHFLRRFPVWYGHRGNHGIILSEGKALSTAAYLRSDPEAFALAQSQLQWVVGRNPFCQSTIFGEGYDYPPLYTPCSGHMVGGFPVGIRTRGNADDPYWPATTCYNYKEVWVDPLSRWLWIVDDLAGLDIGSKMRPTPKTEGTSIIAATGRITDGNLDITIELAGSGSVSLEYRGDNVADERKTVEVRSSDSSQSNSEKTTYTWTTRIVDPESSWIVVIVPDRNIDGRVEVNGFSV